MNYRIIVDQVIKANENGILKSKRFVKVVKINTSIKAILAMMQSKGLEIVSYELV